MENDEEEKEQVDEAKGATAEETEEGEEDARERSEGLRYITRQLPDATVRTNCARGT